MLAGCHSILATACVWTRADNSNGSLSTYILIICEVASLWADSACSQGGFIASELIEREKEFFWLLWLNQSHQISELL